MTIGVSISESDLMKVLGDFLTSILPSSVEVIRGMDNRVPEPTQPDFVTMIPGARERLETNVDSYADVLFQGSIAGTVLTVDSVNYGTILEGSTVFGVGVADNTVITAPGTGTGGAGTYTVSVSQNVAGPIAMASGAQEMLQPTQVTVQLDVHGPNSADNAQIISTLFRDDYAVQSMTASGFDLAPLYADDPKQVPFANDQQQIEYRWVIDARLQVNPTVSVPQQFADQLNAILIDVDAKYPPT